MNLSHEVSDHQLHEHYNELFDMGVALMKAQALTAGIILHDCEDCGCPTNYTNDDPYYGRPTAWYCEECSVRQAEHQNERNLE